MNIEFHPDDKDPLFTYDLFDLSLTIRYLF